MRRRDFITAFAAIAAGWPLAADAQTRVIANALRQLIAAVKLQNWTNPTPPKLSTEFMAASYYEQAHGNLAAALAAARAATEKSPHTGFFLSERTSHGFLRTVFIDNLKPEKCKVFSGEIQSRVFPVSD